MVQTRTNYTSNKCAQAFAQSAMRPENATIGSRFLEKSPAHALITAFSQSSENLKKQEVAFVTREKPQSLSLTQYLRSPEHIDAQRKFEDAGNALTKANPDMGRKLVEKAVAQIQSSVETAQMKQFTTKPAAGMVASR